MNQTTNQWKVQIASDFTPDIENGKQYIPLAASIANRISTLRPISSNWCIYRVPNRLRRIFKMAYTPQVVSIGPLHHGTKDLMPMEEHKWRFLWQFLERTEVSLIEYIAIVKSREMEIRDCYADFISLSSDKFVDLILTDTVFIIEIMLRLHYHKDFVNIENTPYFFNKPRIICQYILPDLRLLENQIPFFIIKDIYERAQRGGASTLLHISMNELCEKFLKDYLFVSMEPDEQTDVCVPEMKHFVDGLRQLCIPPEFNGVEHENDDEVVDEKGLMFTIPSITKLHQAGVRFEAVTGNMFNTSFKDGILKIPKLTLFNKTETLLRNIIAFEQCYCKNSTVSNVSLLTRVIDSDKDLDLLIEYGIIDGAIGDHADVLMRIKTLTHEVAVDRVDFLPRKLSYDLKMYCKVPRHKWLANLRQIYFNTPWTTISMIVATILLLLTFTQTIFSILSFIFDR